MYEKGPRTCWCGTYFIDPGSAKRITPDGVALCTESCVMAFEEKMHHMHDQLELRLATHEGR